MRRLTFAILTMAAVLISAGCSQKSVLLVTQYDDNSPRVAQMQDSIRQAWRAEQVPFQFYTYNMQLNADNSTAWAQQRAALAMVQVKSVQPSLVFVAGDAAMKDFGRIVSSLPTRPRVVYLDVVAQPAEYGVKAATNITGVRNPLPVAETFALMKRLVPNARGVAVISDHSITGNAAVSEINRATQLPLPVMDVRQVNTLDEWVAAVRDLQDKADVLCIAGCSNLLRTADGIDTVPSQEILAITALENRLPDCSFWKEAAGAGGVMAVVSSPLEMEALIAARMAIKAIYYADELIDLPPASIETLEATISPERAAALRVSLPAGIPAHQFFIRGQEPVLLPVSPQAQPVTE